MRLPKQRLTITAAEYRLFRPALNKLEIAFALAKVGRFPYCHPWHRIDYVTSNVYRDQMYDDEMAARIPGHCWKLWDPTQSYKVRLDVFELSALALALRVTKAQQLTNITESVSAEIKLLEAKIEIYRKRAKRSAIARIGKVAYQADAQRWRRFVACLRYNFLYFNIKVRARSYIRWGTMWREQRLQLTQLIYKILADRLFEAPSEVEMKRVVSLAVSTLGRYRVRLKALLQAPHEHTDFLFGFVAKRVELKRLPGAPIPVWEAMSNRADKFREFQDNLRGKRSIPFDTSTDKIIATEPEHPAPIPPKVKPPRRYTHNHQPLTAETLIDAMGTWLYQEVTTPFKLTREVCQQAQHQISRDLLDQYRINTVATSFNGVVQDLRPTDTCTDIPDVINFYAEWMLGILLALRPQPGWMYQAIGTIGGRAMQLAEKAR